MIYKKLLMICSQHHTRGEKIKEFNIAPRHMKYFQSGGIVYRNEKIPIISEGWGRNGKIEILYLQTNRGDLIISDLYYTVL